MVPMDPPEAVQTFTKLFPAVYRRFHRRRPVESYRPSPESLAILRHLAGIGPLTVGEAARHFERSQAAMSEIIRRLEQRGLLERRADERDRRRTLIWLSDDGLQTMRDAEQVLSPRLVRHAFEQMKADDRARLLEGLRALLDTQPHERGFDDD